MKLSLKDVVLLCLVSSVDGTAGAKIIYGLAHEYLREQRCKRRDARGLSEFEMETLRVVLTRLRRSGLIERKQWGIWKITGKGKRRAAEKGKESAYAEFRKKHAGTSLDTILMFDVPELQRKKRDSLRFELLMLGFQLLQKSVWIGWGPLPEEFIEYLQEMHLWQNVHIFQIKNFGTGTVADSQY